MSSVQEGIQALLEVSECLLSCINSGSTESKLKATTEKQILILHHLVDTKKTATQLISDLLHTEEKVAQDLLDRERQKSRVLQELESMERHLGQSAARRDTLQADLQFLQTELDSLRDTEREIQALQCEVDEDTTEVIPSAIYLAQLYHKVTKIKWEYDTEPHVLRGVHYGGDIVTPININTAEQSPGFVSDYLWGLISTEW